MNKEFTVVIDQGTTSTRVIIFDLSGNIVAVKSKDLIQYYPYPTWVEHNPMDIYNDVLELIDGVILENNIDVKKIIGLGVTNQRESTVVFTKDGEPCYNAICWQCRRTADVCDKVVKSGLTEYIKEQTGLPVDAYFSATKLFWILENVPSLRDMVQNDEILFGTIDTWLVYKLTKNKVFVTDRTNASRTMLYNINTLEWDSYLCDYFNIPVTMLPLVKSSSEVYGFVEILGEDIPICAIAGDQQAALFGQHCTDNATVKCTYGTGCFLLMNTDDKKIISQNGLITTIAATGKDNIQYVLEGSVFSGGCVVQWLRDEMGILDTASQSEQYANKVPSTEGVFVVPAFTGLGAPYWDMYAKGTITGITRGTNKYHITRAALEAIAYQVYDVLKAMEKDASVSINTLKVDGGASSNNFLMQFQADINNMVIKKPTVIETTALGIHYLILLAQGIKNLENDYKNTSFTPKMDETSRNDLLLGYKNAVQKTLF